MDYKSLSDSMQKSIADLPIPFLLFDLDLLETTLKMLGEALSPDE